MIGWLQTFVSFSTLITLFYHIFFPHVAFASVSLQEALLFPYEQELASRFVQAQKRIAALEQAKQEAQERYHTITAYSSTVWETDSSPFITAAGTWVRDGVVAANTLPFGTRIMIPELFGEKIFTVEDRMAPKNWHKIDIWFPSTDQARQFGVKRAKVLVLPSVNDAV